MAHNDILDLLLSLLVFYLLFCCACSFNFFPYIILLICLRRFRFSDGMQTRSPWVYNEKGLLSGWMCVGFCSWADLCVTHASPGCCAKAMLWHWSGTECLFHSATLHVCACMRMIHVSLNFRVTLVYF